MKLYGNFVFRSTIVEGDEMKIKVFQCLNIKNIESILINGSKKLHLLKECIFFLSWSRDLDSE